MESSSIAGPALGLNLAAGGVDVLPARPGEPPARALPVRLVARWADVESTRGSYDWSAAERVVAEIVASGFEPILCLTGSNPLYASGDASALDGNSLDAWTAFVRSAWDAFESRVAAYQIWDAPIGRRARPSTRSYTRSS